MMSPIWTVWIRNEPNDSRREREVKLSKQLWCLVEESGHVHQGKRWVFSQLVANNVDTFATADGQVRRTKLIYHKIDTGDQRPIK